MVSFRKSLMVLALLALCAGLASAGVGCSTSGGTAVIRSEGVTELLNPVTVTCTDTVGTASNTGTYNITLYSTSTTVTSVPATKANASDAEIQLTSTGSEVSVGGVIGANGLTVQFNDVVLNGTGLVTVPTTVEFSFTISGLRVNASALTQGGPVFAAGVNFTLLAQPVNNLSPAGLFGDSPILNIANVAYAIPTFAFSLPDNALTFAQCGDGRTATPTATTPSFPTAFDLQFGEVYSAAFKTAADEAINDTGEFVTQGTRLTATLSGIPANTQLYVPIHAGSTATGVLGVTYVNGAKADGSGGTLGGTTGGIKDGAGVYWFAVTPGTPVVYEVTTEGLPVIEKVNIPVSVAFTGVPALAPATGGSVTASYAPVSGNPLASSGPIPRFSAATAVTATGLYGVGACSTSLLYPYITTQSGWGVGLAVSNTGMDPFGNTGQGGTCNFSFFGSNAPAAPVTLGAAGFGDTTAIAPGTTAADGAATAIGSGVVFTGYAIAVCNFQFAHGYAFIVGNVPTGIISNGYLALVLHSGQNLSRGAKANGQFERTGF